MRKRIFHIHIDINCVFFHSRFIPGLCITYCEPDFVVVIRMLHDDRLSIHSLYEPLLDTGHKF